MTSAKTTISAAVPAVPPGSQELHTEDGADFKEAWLTDGTAEGGGSLTIAIDLPPVEAS